jgi:hypothetical protein
MTSSTDRGQPHHFFSLHRIASHSHLLISDLPIQNPPCNTVPVAPLHNTLPAVDTITPSRRRPDRTPGLVGTNAAFLVPDHIRKKFADGWSVHIPLTFLTDKGCTLRDKPSAAATHELLTIDSVTGRIQTSSKPLSDFGELDMTFDEWHQAWRRLLDLIRTFLPQEFLMWEKHYSRILNSENRAEMWPLYLAYDAEIRRRSTQLPIDPSLFSIGIWNDLEIRYTAKKVLSMVQSDLKQHPARTSSAPADTPQNPRATGQGSSFRGQQASSADTSKTGRCIFCGSRTKDHLSRNCPASCNTNGVPCHLHRTEPSGTRQSKSGKRYCFAWNGPSGCDRGSSCNRGEHLCTLCGSSAHTAQLCDAVA